MNFSSLKKNKQLLFYILLNIGLISFSGAAKALVPKIYTPNQKELTRKLIKN